MQFEIRKVEPQDYAQIQEIYAQSVATETASWEYDAPSLEEMTLRIEHIKSNNFPYLVAVNSTTILGFAYANSFRPRIGYRFCCENSIYVAPQYHANGIARKLMQYLIEECADIGLTQMVAVIGDSTNEPSIKLHESLGFERVGFMPKVGFKFDKWLDSVIMQKCIAKM